MPASAEVDWTSGGAWPFQPRWFASPGGRMHYINEGPAAAARWCLPLRLFRAPGTGEVLVKGLNMFVRGFLFRAGVTHPERLTPEARRAYLAPHPSWRSRTAMLAFPRQIPSGPGGEVADLGGRLDSGLRRHFTGRPVAIAWGMKDPAFTPQWLELWLRTFPHADVLRLPDAGHYLQEDAHEEIVPALLRFLDPAAAPM